MKNQFEVFEEWLALCPVKDNAHIEAWNEEDNYQFYIRQWIFSNIPENKVKEFEKWMKSCPYSTSKFTKDKDPIGGDIEISCYFKVPNDGSFPDEEDDN